MCCRGAEIRLNAVVPASSPHRASRRLLLDRLDVFLLLYVVYKYSLFLLRVILPL